MKRFQFASEPHLNTFSWTTLSSVENRRNGVLSTKQFERKVSRFLGGQLRASRTCTFERFCRTEDADLRQNRLAVLDENMIVIYDVTQRCGDEERQYQQLAKIPIPIENHRYLAASLPSVRWSPEGALLSTAGTSLDRNALRVLDSSTLQAIEMIKLETFGSTCVYTHEHSQIDPALVAVGTSQPQVFVTDLRTGNVTLSNATQHTDGVNCIAWSYSDENLLVSTSNKEALVWDKRYFAKTALQILYGHKFNIIPDIKFLDSNRILVMICKNAIYVNNVYTGETLDVIDDVHLKSYFQKARFKFGLNRDASIAYFPVKRAIRGVDLRTKNVVMDAKGGHIYPAEMVFFNDYTKELYSLNRTHEAIVWTPFR